MSKASLISARTSLSQCSFKLSAQLVCCTNKCRIPAFVFFRSEDARDEVMKSVIRCDPRPIEGRRRGTCEKNVPGIVCAGLIIELKDWANLSTRCLGLD